MKKLIWPMLVAVLVLSLIHLGGDNASYRTVNTDLTSIQNKQKSQIQELKQELKQLKSVKVEAAVKVMPKQRTTASKKVKKAPVVASKGFYTITGYSTSAGEGTNFTAADGTRVKRGVCAGPPHLAFGTRINIPGYGDCTIHDRGGAIQGNRIDAYFPSVQEARSWGRRSLDIRFY